MSLTQVERQVDKCCYLLELHKNGSKVEEKTQVGNITHLLAIPAISLTQVNRQVNKQHYILAIHKTSLLHR